MRYCHFFVSVEQLKRETPEDGFTLIFAKCGNGSYTLGWKKEKRGTLYGDWIRIMTHEDGDAAYERFKDRILENARQTMRTIKQEQEVRSHGRQRCQKSL